MYNQFMIDISFCGDKDVSSDEKSQSLMLRNGMTNYPLHQLF
jgi:hypothetical protein